MSEPSPLPPPVAPSPPWPKRQRGVLPVLFGMSLMLNLLVGAALAAALFLVWLPGDDSTRPLAERHRLGKKSAADKIAIIQIEGVILEGMLGFVERQIEQAAQDSKVKAVVLRINSPGGSITASDDLYQRLVQLRDGDGERDRPSRPMVVSMGSLAASGGYYIAVPGQVLYAERSSITGSIGVFAAFPNLTGLAQKVGVDLEVVARGALKRAGSPFHQMKPEERAMWEDLVEHGYRQFKQVIENNRPALKGKLEEPVVNEMRTATGPKTEATLGQKFHYVRRRADGGIFTADQARTLGLIDKLGYLEDAIKEARDLAQLTEYQAFTYEKPFNISELLLGSKAVPPNLALDPSCLAEGALPRLWYLAPQSELAGVLQACSRRE